LTLSLGSRLWRLMVAVAFMAVILCIAVRWNTDRGETRAIGYVKARLEFQVRDLDSGRPIDGTTIRLADSDTASFPSEEPNVFELRTGPDGAAIKVVELRYYESRGIPSNRLLGYRVNYPPWEVCVEARGYQDFEAPFRNYEVKDRRFHENGPPPPVVRLRRAPP
jgi:hypothetical protein